MRYPKVGDNVREPYPPDSYRKGFDPANGVITEVIGRVYVVVKWPDGTCWKYHYKELKVS